MVLPNAVQVWILLGILIVVVPKVDCVRARVTVRVQVRAGVRAKSDNLLFSAQKDWPQNGPVKVMVRVGCHDVM